MAVALRTLTNQAAEAGVPSADKFVDLPGSARYLEIVWQGLTLGGTVAASSVTFGIWRRADSLISKAGSFTIASSDLASYVPPIVDLHGDAVAVVVESFAGGTAPTVSGTIHARRVDP